MRIGIYDPYLDDCGGGEKYMMTIAEVLSHKHTVSIFWDNPEDIKKVSERFSLNLEQTRVVENIFSPRVSLIQRFLKSMKYDGVIVLSDGSIPLVGSKKLFLHMQQPIKREKPFSFFEKIKLSRVNTIFCNSYFTKSFIEKVFPVKTIVIFPPVTLKKANLTRENIILHVGRFRVMSPQGLGTDFKKQSVMLQTFKHMIDKGLKDWKFVMAVSVQEKDRESFDEMAGRAKGYPIEFLVNQTNDKLWDLYSKAKIYWHASGFGENLAKHPELAEHFGISTVEAMGAGAVPIVINAGGQKEIVSQHVNGLLWDSLDELQEDTLSLIHDPKEWERLSLQAEKDAKRFTKEEFAKQIENLFV